MKWTSDFVSSMDHLIFPSNSHDWFYSLFKCQFLLVRSTHLHLVLGNTTFLRPVRRLEPPSDLLRITTNYLVSFAYIHKVLKSDKWSKLQPQMVTSLTLTMLATPRRRHRVLVRCHQFLCYISNLNRGLKAYRQYFKLMGRRLWKNATRYNS